jgi:hypothetical protein
MFNPVSTYCLNNFSEFILYINITKKSPVIVLTGLYLLICGFYSIY